MTVAKDNLKMKQNEQKAIDLENKQQTEKSEDKIKK